MNISDSVEEEIYIFIARETQRRRYSEMRSQVMRFCFTKNYCLVSGGGKIYVAVSLNIVSLLNVEFV